MIYDDIVYGKVDISEPIILDIIASPYMQRLKGVDQAGYWEPYFPGSSHSRFGHSIGVYILLKKYGASLEEQIAGLIHDVSHGTFSHCLDYVFDEGDEKKQNHQDNIFEEFLKNTDIPQILVEYGFNIEYILDDTRHPLKENNLPDICADRIDYSLRDAVHSKNISNIQINSILNNLKVIDNNWIFDSFEIAKQYSEFFLKMNEIYWSGLESAVMFQTVGDFFRYAWKNKYVSREDFYTTDEEILNKVKKYLNTDEKLYFYRQRMNGIIKYENNSNDFDTRIFCKSRIIDPFFMIEGKKLRVSDVDPQSKNLILNNKAKEYFIRFEK